MLKRQQQEKITMLTTKSEVQFYDRWHKLHMRACCRSGKTPPELQYVNTNCKQITYHLQSNWNTRKENWCKLKEMHCGRKHKCQQRCQLRGICPSHFIPTCTWPLKNSNRENNNLMLFLEPQQITPSICHLFFSSSLISCMPVSTLRLRFLRYSSIEDFVFKLFNFENFYHNTMRLYGRI